MMQQLSIFLGHPMYSLLVVLAGLIFFAGLGSALSARFVPFFIRNPYAAAEITAIFLASYLVAADPLVRISAAGSLGSRITLSLILIAPIGLAMGLCFPTGVRRLQSTGNGDTLPWMWAINGACAVVATFLAVLISMEFTIGTSLIVAVLLYAAASF